MARIWIPLPDEDFDLTEVTVPWRLLTEAGHEVCFTTEHGQRAHADPRLIDGVIFGQLGADPEPIAWYRELEQDRAFSSPLRWSDVDLEAFDALVLPGGHAPGMRQYLGSAELQALVARFFATERPVAAICHGVLPLARAAHPTHGRSVLHGFRTTCLPKWMELSAWAITAWKLGNYYRTYPITVQDEVSAALASPSDFARGPLGLRRGNRADHRPAFVVEDRHYLSARWPGDAYLLGERLLARL